MSLATLISFSAFAIQLGVALLMLGLSRAPGWARARLFVPVALSVAVYSALSIPAAFEGTPDAVRVFASRLSYFVAAVHCATWIVYVFGEPGRRCWDLDRWACGIIAIDLALGVAALVPGWVVHSDRWHDSSVPLLHLRYHNPTTTTFGDLVSLWLLGVLVLPFREYGRRALRGDPSARYELVAFVFFFACGVNDALAMNGVIRMPFLVDVAFLAIVLAVVSETVSRVTRDAGTLHMLTHSLESEVRTRTQERNDARDALMGAERLATLGRLARGVGHEINNPLTYVQTNIEYVREHLGGTGASEELVHALDDAVEGTLQIQTIIAELQAYAQDREGERRRVSLSRVAHGALQLVGAELKLVARVEEDFAPVPLVMADRIRLSQVFIHLLSNAAQSMAKSGRPVGTITLRTRTTAAGEACVEVVDEGEGIAPENLARVFQPYFSTRTTEGRAGLGLFVTRTVIDALRGRIEIESEVGKGTLVRVVLPNGEFDDTPTPGGDCDDEPSDDDLGDRARFLSLRTTMSDERFS